RVLQFWVDATGLTASGGSRRRGRRAPDRAELLPRVRKCIDLDQLEAWCLFEDEAVVEEAALRLLEIGEGGAAPLAALLARAPPPPPPPPAAGLHARRHRLALARRPGAGVPARARHRPGAARGAALPARRRAGQARRARPARNGARSGLRRGRGKLVPPRAL